MRMSPYRTDARILATLPAALTLLLGGCGHVSNSSETATAPVAEGDAPPVAEGEIVGDAPGGEALTSELVETPFPILFVTQVPLVGDFANAVSTFGNHRTDNVHLPRGGDLWIRYGDGTLKNLTEAAGWGEQGFQGANSIAVREPCVHWQADKALFSMAVGMATPSDVYYKAFWQIYEVTGLGLNDTPVIKRVNNQPPDANNVSPAYASDGRVLFISDRPLYGQEHLRPQRDEYEMTESTTGLWSLNPTTGDLFRMTASPSGDFGMFVDSFGRVLFHRWDHLEQDQFANADLTPPNIYQSFDWSDESETAVPLATATEVFPEPLPSSPLIEGTEVVGHRMERFFPWMVRQDGTGLEMLNHIGRHEFLSFFPKNLHGDLNIGDFFLQSSHYNQRRIENIMHLAEDPSHAGRYYAIDSPTFFSHGCGQVISFIAAPGDNPDQFTISYVTHPDTQSPSNNPSPNHSGLYRDVRPLIDGRVLVSHTDNTESDENLGTPTNPISKFDLRLKLLEPHGPNLMKAGAPLTGGIYENISWWQPFKTVYYNGPLWELDAVEVRARATPPMPNPPLELPELTAFALAGVDVDVFRAWLWQQGLALIVVRDVTTRDDIDEQQPYNLRVTGTTHQTVGSPGMVYGVEHLKIFQGDMLRSKYTQQGTIEEGRRVLARPVHDVPDIGYVGPNNPGAARVLPDGSVAALVPAARPVTWQLDGPEHKGLVRERFWLSFQPGEIRSCGSCHAVNTTDQAGNPPPTNAPLALTALLQQWKSDQPQPPVLGPQAIGTTGEGAGGPYSVLRINGSTGGPDYRVDATVGQPITIQMDQPPSFPGNSKFGLWVLVGAPHDLNTYEMPFGALMFPPSPFAPADMPGFVTLTNSFWVDSTALLGSNSAPWTYAIPNGVPFPLTLTFQGVIEDEASGDDPLGATNAVVLHVQ